MPRLLVVVPSGEEARVGPRPGIEVVHESDLVKCHDLDDVRRARAGFVTISPVAPTLTKPGYGPALGVDGVRAAADVTDVPLYALGGITPDNARSFLDAGAYGVAVMGAVLRADDPERMVSQLLEAIA